MQRLAEITNIIPLIAKSDTLSLDELEATRHSIADQLRCANIRSFNLDAETGGSLPYSVCSAPSDDSENMDASLLMSPDYVQPLISSQLRSLVQQIFDKDIASCLRHVAASKLVRTQSGSVANHMTTPTFSRSISRPSVNSEMSLPNPISHSESESWTTVPHITSLSPYLQARIADHTQQEEKLAHIRLAKWASDLQRSMQNERARYEAIARGERNVWLKEKLDESSPSESCIPDTTSGMIRRPDNKFLFRKVDLVHSRHGTIDPGDPLGLLRWNEAMRRRGWIAFQVVGSFGIIGAMAVWAARTWGLEYHGAWSRGWWVR